MVRFCFFVVCLMAIVSADNIVPGILGLGLLLLDDGK